MRAKADKTNMKQIVEQLMEEKSKKLEAKRKQMEANRKRREENTRKNEIVQVITNTKKLKNIKKKHLRMIETRWNLRIPNLLFLRFHLLNLSL